MPTNEQWAEAVDALAWFCFRSSVALDRQPGAERLRKIGSAMYSKLSMHQTKREEIPRLVDHTFNWLDGPATDAPALGGERA